MPHPDVVAKCPYYEKENQTTIFCESNIRVREEGKSGYHAQVFQSSKQKTQYMKDHCRNYPETECPYANYMNRFYERIERGGETKWH